jgi:Ca2+-transporting ATPase
MTDWYKREWGAVLDALEVKLDQGLSNEEARHRLEQFGPNELADKGGKKVWAILWEQLIGVMTVILIVSAAVSLFLGDYEDAIAILAIVV